MNQCCSIKRLEIHTVTCFFFPLFSKFIDFQDERHSSIGVAIILTAFVFCIGI